MKKVKEKEKKQKNQIKKIINIDVIYLLCIK